MSVPLPHGMDFDAWARRVVEQYSLEQIPTQDWRAWVARLRMNPGVPETPLADGFGDWRAWAQRAMEALY